MENRKPTRKEKREIKRYELREILKENVGTFTGIRQEKFNWDNSFGLFVFESGGSWLEDVHYALSPNLLVKHNRVIARKITVAVATSLEVDDQWSYGINKIHIIYSAMSDSIAGIVRLKKIDFDLVEIKINGKKEIYSLKEKAFITKLYDVYNILCGY